MQKNKQLTLASANLLNFMEPPNAYYEFDNIYQNEEWQDKVQWTSQAIRTLNADVVALQEVFSIDAARALCEGLGFPYFACIDQPAVEQDYVFSKPVVALASKHPITQCYAVEPPEDIGEHYLLSLPAFSRKPLFALIELPDIGDIAVYVCHLKSQRATESNRPDEAHPLVGRWLSSQQRGWEALMLRLAMERFYRQHPVPTVLMGDINQTLTSDITGMLTEKVEQPDKDLILKDAWRLLNEQGHTRERPATHYHFAKGNVLDYILLSQEFHPDSQYSLADVIEYITLDTHLIDPKYDRDKQASDHAFIAAKVRFIV